MSEFGPEVTTRRRCTGCKALVSEPYRVQGDTGVDLYCSHPVFSHMKDARQYIADSCRDTPAWCPASITARESGE